MIVKLLMFPYGRFLQISVPCSSWFSDFLCWAACLLQREVVDYARVQEYSLKVLRWRAGDIKALYRAGVATLELGDAQTARQYLVQASRGNPNGKKKQKTVCVF